MPAQGKQVVNGESLSSPEMPVDRRTCPRHITLVPPGVLRTKPFPMRPAIVDAFEPPFTVSEPAQHTVPFVFNVPHAGAVYPTDFLVSSRLDSLALRRSEDAFVDELVAPMAVLGAPVMAARFPRAYLDLNREPYELDPRMFEGRLPAFANTRSMRVAGGLGTIPRIVADGQEIYGAHLA